VIVVRKVEFFVITLLILVTTLSDLLLGASIVDEIAVSTFLGLSLKSMVLVETCKGTF
jgi:hypothetical protein